jgi:uncharacterized protein
MSNRWRNLGRRGFSSRPASATHRTWPPPSTPWAMTMRWTDLAFLHWPVECEALRPLIPEELELDTRDGEAWLGVTPFTMSKVRARFTPPLPGLSRFPELNTRTYVSAQGKPGVWFFSLDAGSRLAVQAARLAFGLPYHKASMSLARRTDGIRYRCHRTGTSGRDLRFEASYRPTGPVAPPKPGSLEHWLTERYCLYSLRGGSLYRGEIHHDPWPLQPASAEVTENTMADPLGIGLDRSPPLVHFSQRLDVVAWLPSRIERAST